MKSPLRLLGEIRFRNPKKGVRRLTVGHCERFEIESLTLCPLPEQFPIVTTRVGRRYQTPRHRRMECLRSQQSSKRLA